MDEQSTLTPFPQIYETTVIDPTTERALDFIVIPARSLEDPSICNDSNAAATALEVRIHCTIAADRIAHGLTAVLAVENKSDERLENLNGLVSQLPEVFKFAELVSSTNLIPFEQSPLTAKSILEIAATAFAAHHGAVLGFSLVSGGGPLLLIAVPTGIVLCVAAERVVGPALGELARSSIVQIKNSVWSKWQSLRKR